MRRVFPRSPWLLVLLLVALAPPGVQAQDEEPIVAHPLRGGLYVIDGAGDRIGVVPGELAEAEYR